MAGILIPGLPGAAGAAAGTASDGAPPEPAASANPLRVDPAAAAALQQRAAAAGAGQGMPPQPVPALRTDLTLQPAEPEDDGAPAWLLHDPVAEGNFRLGWVELELLRRMDGETLPEEVAASATAHVGFAISEQQVVDLARFLRQHNLVQVDAQQKALFRMRSERRHGPVMRFLHSYLFLRLPLVKPDRFLAATLPTVRWLGHPASRAVLCVTGLFALFLTLRDLETYAGTIVDFFSLEGVLAYAVALCGIKALHELGHGYIAKAQGARVPRMGVALIVLWPVLYTDTTDAWRATGRRGRLWIDAGGILVELAIGALALLLWHLLPDGPLRSACFLLSSVTLVLTLAINLNPLMRFDGYYLFADWLGVANLQDRSFAVAKWWLRERLFGYGDTPPETARPLWLVYAFATWIYRFFLFLGIALLVYSFFVKLLGIVLFVLEIWFFILHPVTRELAIWVRRRGEARMRTLMRTAAILALLVGALLIPWRSELSLPAILQARHAVVYLTEPGRVVEVMARDGAQVRAGQALAVLESPDLNHEIAQTERRIAELRRQRDSRGMDDRLLEQTAVIDADLAAQTATLSRLRARRQDLVRRAPFDGTVRGVVPDLRAGQWLGEGERLAAIVGDATPALTAYVPEDDLSRLSAGAEARFVADGALLADIPARLETLPQTAVHDWEEPYLAAHLGGPVAVRPLPARDGREERLVPAQAQYRLRLELGDLPTLPARPVPGRVVVAAAPRSALDRLWAGTVGLMRREFSF